MYIGKCRQSLSGRSRQRVRNSEWPAPLLDRCHALPDREFDQVGNGTDVQAYGSGAASWGCGGARHPRRSLRPNPCGRTHSGSAGSCVGRILGSHSGIYGGCKRPVSPSWPGATRVNIGTLHGPALHREMERMAEAGLAPLAIQGRNAGWCPRHGAWIRAKLGTVEPGKRADLPEPDPQSDIRHARRIYRVAIA